LSQAEPRASRGGVCRRSRLGRRPGRCLLMASERPDGGRIACSCPSPWPSPGIRSTRIGIVERSSVATRFIDREYGLVTMPVGRQKTGLRRVIKVDFSRRTGRNSASRRRPLPFASRGLPERRSPRLDVPDYRPRAGGRFRKHFGVPRRNINRAFMRTIDNSQRRLLVGTQR
jgi:hypothetical protein